MKSLLTTFLLLTLTFNFISISYCSHDEADEGTDDEADE